MLGPAIAFNGTLYTTNAILQAYGHPVIPVRNMAIGGLVKLLISYLLIGVPQINVMGSAISTVASYGLIMILNFISVHRVAAGFSSAMRSLPAILLSAGVMGAVSFGLYKLLCMAISPRLAVLPAILLAVAVYALCAVRTKAITYELVTMLPKGDRLARLLRVRES